MKRCIVVDFSYSVLKICQTGSGLTMDGNHCSVLSVRKYLSRIQALYNAPICR